MGLGLNAMLLRVKGQACCPDPRPVPRPWVQQEGWAALAMWSLQSCRLWAHGELKAWGFPGGRALTPRRCCSTLLRAQEPGTCPGRGERAGLMLPLRLWGE